MFNVTISGPSHLPHSAVHAQLTSGVSPHQATPLATLNVTVTNVGPVPSDYVVLLFATPPNPGVNGAPIR